MDESRSAPTESQQELTRLRHEVESLHAQLEDSQETLRAIQEGAVDALVIDTPEGQRVFTLQGGEHPYRALIEQMLEGAATLTPEGVIHYCNGRFAEMLKVPLERVMGGRIDDFVAPTDRALLTTMLSEGGGRAELALTAGDATEMPTLVSAISLRTEGPAAICLVVSDLTERKRHEAQIHELNEELEDRVIERTAQLAEARDLLAVTLASIGDGVIVTDAVGRVTFLNGEAEHLTGWNSREAEGHPLPEVFHIINEHSRQPVENPVEKVMRLGTVVGLANHTILIARDGREIPIDDSGAPIRQSDGTMQGVVLVFRDFTEQKRGEEALRESEQRFRVAQELSPDGFTIFRPVRDAQGVVVDFTWVYENAAIARMNGTDPKVVVGRRLLELFPGHSGSPFLETYLNVAETGEPRISEASYHGDSISTPTWFRVAVVSMGEDIAILSQDITERKRMEGTLNEARVAAERASEAKGRFLANISHELRTPMNAILGLVDLALPRQTDATAKEFLQTTRESADLLLTLLNDLLDSSKIEAGKLELESAPFSLRRMLDQMMRVLAVRASEVGLAFSCRIPAELPDAVVGDQVRLRQVLLNLAWNAIKFTEQGEVELSVRAVSQDREVVCLEFAVRDTGIGISPSEIEHLFQPFSQADASTTRRFGGTGLGLSICSSIVRMMNGHIWVESEVGKGSTFYFTVPLPLASEVPTEEETVSEIPAEAASTLRLLLVEDNPANQTLAAYILRDRGHTVEIVGDGHQALRMAQDNAYDVILMDVQMPGMDGLEATKAIRARENGNRRVPIIAMTAHAMKGDRERCLAAGMDGYLPKPIDAHAMITLVESLAAGTALPMGSSTPPRAADVFDPEVAIKRCFNSQELMGQIIDCFFNDVNNLLPQMRLALQNGDLVEVGHIGHRMKGTLVHLGAESAREVAGRLEQFIFHPGEQAEANEAFRAIEQECEVFERC